MLKPPFSEETARQKVEVAQNLWNTRDPDRVVLAYTEDSQWRNRNEFLLGHQQIRAFLKLKWQRELGYQLRKELFLFANDKIAVQFFYEWHDSTGQWHRAYGLEHWTFAADGRMQTRTASINDLAIDPQQRILT